MIDRSRRGSKPTTEEVGDIRKPHPGRKLTEQEFVDWCTEYTHAEWVNGEVIIMSPVNWNHADINAWLVSLIHEFVEFYDSGYVVGSGVQMRLANIVSRREADLLFVSKQREDIIRPTYLNGPADLVLEIVSPESVARDWREKHAEYAKGGVREYWVVDPASRRVEVYVLTRSKTYKLIEEKDGKVSSSVLKGLYIRPEWLWQPKLPKISEGAKELGLR